MKHESWCVLAHSPAEPCHAEANALALKERALALRAALDEALEHIAHDRPGHAQDALTNALAVRLER